jgi:hypothetical protein
LPVVNDVPPVASLYQSISAPGEEARSVIVPPGAQRDADVTVGVAGNAITVAVAELE